MYMEFFLLPIPLKCFKTTSFSVQPFTHTTMAMTTLQSAAYSSGTFTHTHTLIVQHQSNLGFSVSLHDTLTM